MIKYIYEKRKKEKVCDEREGHVYGHGANGNDRHSRNFEIIR